MKKQYKLTNQIIDCIENDCWKELNDLDKVLKAIIKKTEQFTNKTITKKVLYKYLIEIYSTYIKN